ncbi:MAG: glycerate kinase [Miltoncostaeaceae bacterium]
MIVVAPGAFKGALSPAEAARAIAAGLRLVLPGAEVRAVPVADGGEGTADALVASAGGRRRMVDALDPLGRPIRATLGELPGHTAVVELAQASGYERLADGERDPERAGTFGTGLLIRAALDLGATTILVGLGGSATTDGGLGLAIALGVRALDAEGTPLEGVGADMGRVARLDPAALDPRLAGVTIRVACDVANPFHGPDGAAHVFGPQKGADPAAVARLDAGLERLADVLAGATGVDVQALPGSGAAGGAAGALAALFGAELVPGAPLVLEALGMAGHLDGATLCVTGEGSLDATSLSGKAPAAVAAMCAERGIPCVALCGAIGLGPRALAEAGFTAAFPIGQVPRRLPDALAAAESDLARAAASLGRLWGAAAT